VAAINNRLKRGIFFTENYRITTADFFATDIISWGKVPFVSI